MGRKRHEPDEIAAAKRNAAEVARLNREAVLMILEARASTDRDRTDLLYEDAEKLLREAEQLDESDPVTCTNLAAVLCDNARWRKPGSPARERRAASRAEELAARAIDTRTVDGNVYFNMAVALTLLGRPSIAQDFFVQSAELDAGSETVSAMITDDKPAPHAAHLSRFLSKSKAAVVADLGSFFADYVGEMAVVVAFLDCVLIAGQILSASEVRIEPTPDGGRVGWRSAANEPWSFPDTWLIPSERYRAVVSRCKIVAYLDVSRRGVRQSGKWNLDTGLITITASVAIEPGENGESVLLGYQ